MKRVLGFIAIVLLIVVGLFYSWSQRIADGHNLPAKNSVKMHISAGGVTVVGTDADDYKVTLESASDEAAKNAKISVDRNHQPVLINISHLPQVSRVRVEIPRNSNLAVTMNAGELIIRNIEGNKYAMLRSGRMVIDISDAANYSSVNASVIAGAIHAPALDRDKGGMFRFMSEHRANGKPNINAHVTAGELVIENAPSATKPATSSDRHSAGRQTVLAAN